MRKYHYTKYIELVEKTEDNVLKQFMTDEISILKQIVSFNENILDLGAGYGRILEYKSQQARYSGIELNQGMYDELSKRCKRIPNSFAYKEDITKVKTYYKFHNYEDLLILLLQNTLGTIEGDWKLVLDNIISIMADKKSQLLISLFRADRLHDYGLNMFNNISEMVGEYDSVKSNLKEGLFLSKTGYEAKWWSDSEIDYIINKIGGKVSCKIETEYYYIFHITS